MALKIPFDDIKKLSEEDRAKTIAVQMIKHGGGFARMLGKKLAKAELEEIETFKKAYPSYWNRFSKMAEMK